MDLWHLFAYTLVATMVATLVILWWMEIRQASKPLRKRKGK